MRIMFHQIENLNKQIEIMKKNQIEILQLKSTITEMKTLVEGLTGRFELVEVRTRELKKGQLQVASGKNRQIRD